MEKEEFDFERFKEEAMKGLYEGKKMGGTDGVFAPMLKHRCSTITQILLQVRVGTPISKRQTFPLLSLSSIKVLLIKY